MNSESLLAPDACSRYRAEDVLASSRRRPPVWAAIKVVPQVFVVFTTPVLVQKARAGVFVRRGMGKARRTGGNGAAG